MNLFHTRFVFGLGAVLILTACGGGDDAAIPASPEFPSEAALQTGDCFLSTVGTGPAAGCEIPD